MVVGVVRALEDQAKIANRSRKRSHKVDEIGVGKIRTFSFLPIPFTTPSLKNTRDLKHQDGRLRRGRHIRVKAEARPASRFTRLSMLSNIATTSSRQFLEKIPPRKYLENKSSFAIARGEVMVAYD